MSSLLTIVSTSGLVDLALKSLAVMLLAWSMTALLGRASAAWRHLVWCLAALSLLLLPALALALPAWRVDWLPPWTVELAHSTTTQRRVVPQDPDKPLDQNTVYLPSALEGPVTETPVSPSSRIVETERLPAASIPWLAIGWATGGLLSLMPLAVGLWQLWAVQRRSRLINDPRWLMLLDEMRRKWNMRRSVQLRQSTVPMVPLTWGALRPVLLVPAEADAWPDPRRRLVLLHELAHVRRWDWLTQLVAHVACASYWFNPLVWLAARRMRIERERACDDLVLSSGARASDYAEELLALAAGLSKLRLSTLVAVPMARRGSLEDRLHGILDKRRSRAALTTAAVCLGMALAAAAIAPLAMLRAAPPKPPQPTAEQSEPNAPNPEEKPAEDQSAPPDAAPEESELKLEEIAIVKKPAEAAPANKAEEKPADTPPAKTVTIRGKVLDDATGEPIGQITTQAGKFDPADPKKVTWGYSESRSSSRDGSFSTTVRWAEGWTARVIADGYIPQPVLTSAPPDDKDELEVVIRLRLGPKVRGVVLDHNGKPVKDAAVFAIGPTGLNLAAGQAIDNDSHSVRTDAEGRFELPTGEAKSLAVTHATMDAWSAAIADTGEVTVRLPEPAKVEIELAIDGANNESVIFYQLLTQGRKEFAGLRLEREVKMSNPGTLSLASLPPGKYQLCRNVRNNLGEIGMGAMLERTFFELKAGEIKSIDFARENGAPVRGKVTGPADTKLMGIVVSVRSLLDQKSPFDNLELPTIYASHTAAEDGSFQTERIQPGKYLLVAEAYTPLAPEQRFRSGIIRPSHQVEMNIDVPANGELTVPDMVLKPADVDE